MKPKIWVEFKDIPVGRSEVNGNEVDDVGRVIDDGMPARRRERTAGRRRTDQQLPPSFSALFLPATAAAARIAIAPASAVVANLQHAFVRHLRLLPFCKQPPALPRMEETVPDVLMQATVPSVPCGGCDLPLQRPQHSMHFPVRQLSGNPSRTGRTGHHLSQSHVGAKASHTIPSILPTADMEGRPFVSLSVPIVKLISARSTAFFQPRPHGATVARSTPDRKVIRSNRVGVKASKHSFFWCFFSVRIIFLSHLFPSFLFCLFWFFSFLKPNMSNLFVLLTFL